MTEVWLKFRDENGEERRVEVRGESFTVGRHSASDLAISNGKLSREHIRIEMFGEDILVSDSGSSNGTTLNGEPLTTQMPLHNGDILVLGGGLEIKAVIGAEEPEFEPEPEEEVFEDEPQPEAAAAAGIGAGSIDVSSASGEKKSGGSLTFLLVVAPIFGVFILILLGLVVYFVTRPKKPDYGDVVYSDRRERETPTPKDKEISTDPRSSATPSSGSTPGGSSSNGTVTGTGTPPPMDLSDPAKKCEENGSKFLRAIAQHEPTAFISGEQAKTVSDKIKQMNLSSIADNINAARRGSAQIKQLATAKGLKPQLLATAALAKLGASKGDPVSAARDMADTLSKLQTPIGNELGNDCLLLIAAYDQGASAVNSFPAMLQQLTTKATEGSREVRTIWYLHKNGKISDSEYNFALQFLAIGTITQNPKDFGVNAEALTL